MLFTGMKFVIKKYFSYINSTFLARPTKIDGDEWAITPVQHPKVY